MILLLLLLGTKMKNNIIATEFTGKPIRKIGIQTRSITGRVPTGQKYESSLERDLMILLMFDDNVSIYTPQPITISYQENEANTWRKYTPDGLIEWHNHDCLQRKPILLEVKYREAFKNGNWKGLLKKFRAAKSYAQIQGWDFKIYTEDDIRTPLLENIKFLNRYTDIADPHCFQLVIMDQLEKIKNSTPTALLESIFQDKWNQAKALPIIWSLIARRVICCDLSTTLTMNSNIWIIK